ncbi:MAG: Ig-like domain-containing protein [Myxococcota bacterium]
MTFTYTVSDPYDHQIRITATVDYQGVNDAPVASPDGPFRTQEERTLLIYASQLLVNDRDVDSPSLAVRLDANQPPVGGTAELDALGNLVFHPAPDFSGTATVWYTAYDFELNSALTPVEIEVEAVNDPPSSTSWAYGTIGGPVTDNVLTPSNGTAGHVIDPDGDAVEIRLSNEPAVGTVSLAADGTFTYTPKAGYTGEDRFWYTAFDPQGLSAPPAKVEFLIVQDPVDNTTTEGGQENPCPDPTLWYLDQDGDGWGTPEFVLARCVQPVNYVAATGDCDDTRRNVHPNAAEVPGDGVDQDCDGSDNRPVPVGSCSSAGSISLSLVSLVILMSLTRRRRGLAAAAALLAPLLLLTAPAMAQTPEASTDGACPADASAELDRSMEALWSAFVRMDETSFDQANKVLNVMVACLDEVPPAPQIARLHEAMALGTFVNGQARASRRSLAAVRIVDPAWAPDPEMFPPSHGFVTSFNAATDPGPVQPIGKISPNEWLVDGIVRDDAPVERAFLLQVRENGRIAWSGYLWDFEEIPDRGQSRKRTSLQSPHAWWLGTSVHGGLVTSKQTPIKGNTAWAPQSGGTFAGGADVTARFTPNTVIGGEIGGSIIGPSDPVAGGGGLPTGHALVLIGGAGWVGEVQPFAAARLGAGLERFRSWGNAYQGEVGVELATVPSAVVGIVGGVRADRYRAELTVDGSLAWMKVPYQLRFRADGGALVKGPLAVEAMVESRFNGLGFEDRVERAQPVESGERTNLDFRLGGTLSLWL